MSESICSINLAGDGMLQEASLRVCRGESIDAVFDVQIMLLLV